MELEGIIFSILGAPTNCTGGETATIVDGDMQQRTPGSRTPCARMKEDSEQIGREIDLGSF